MMQVLGVNVGGKNSFTSAARRPFALVVILHARDNVNKIRELGTEKVVVGLPIAYD